MAKATRRGRREGFLRKAKGKGRTDTTKAPAWWISAPDETEAFLRSLKGVTVREIGRSAGGRAILAAEWGRREDLPGRTCNSLASAIAGGSPEAFYGQGERKRQGFLFVGDAHGMELEGTVAALNFLNVVVTGKDLRGRAWPRMQREGRKLRIVIIPFLNIDGRSRFAHVRHILNVLPEDHRWISQGDLKTGEKLAWPKSKLISPVPSEQVKHMGAYFNDSGVNLVYDTGLGVAPQPETRALLELCREEMPDFALCSHTDNGSLCQPADAFIPDHFRQRQVQIGAVAGTRCRREGMKKSAIAQRLVSYAGQILYQTDLIYHASGALPMLVEFPCGYQNVPNNLDEILDIGMYVLEEIVAFGTAYRFRPSDPKWK